MTDGKSFTTAFTVAQSPEAAFAAITNTRGWWSGDIEGPTDTLDGVFTYRYQDLHYSKQQVIELVPGRRVAWRVLDANVSFLVDKTEWKGTTITFDIARKGAETEVVFTHIGLEPTVECYEVCTTSWTALIQGSLKQLIETGKTELIELEAPAA
jgi:hypothetical protein